MLKFAPEAHAMARRYAVIGLGQFGRAIATALAAKGGEVIAIDNNQNHIESIKDDVAHAITMDSTDKKLMQLLQQNGKLTMRELSEKLNLSITPIYERLRRLENRKIITGYHAHIDECMPEENRHKPHYHQRIIEFDH